MKTPRSGLKTPENGNAEDGGTKRRKRKKKEVIPTVIFENDELKELKFANRKTKISKIEKNEELKRKNGIKLLFTRSLKKVII